MTTPAATPVSRVADLRTRNVARVRADAPAEAAWLRMQEKSIHHLVVVEGEEIVGVLSSHDLGEERGEDWRRNRLAGDFMSAPAETITPGATAAEAARRLRKRGRNCLVVCEREELRGILTSHDLLLLVEQGAGSIAEGEDP